ncbi:hypothetical protein [Streptomyces flaveolus]|uniref:hypothetical protein n=1 Tax=Streptomyces flaveolus TaxID=67297 RepID=UPI0038048FB5
MQDRKLPSGGPLFAPYREDLPEYGQVIQNFWNNANGHTVPDPLVRSSSRRRRQRVASPPLEMLRCRA